MTKKPPETPIRVCLPALPESTPTSLYGLFEVLSSVGIAWPELTGEGERKALFDLRIVSADGRPFAGALGAPIAPHASIGQVDDTDVVIVSDLALAPDAEFRERWSDEARWITAQYSRGAIVCSVCTGAVLLAAAGLLDRQPATTHWSACGLIGEQFPAIDLQPERILVPAGEGHRIITSGGAASWEDLVLYLIARLCGKAEAIRTAKVFLFGDRSDGQLPYAAVGRPKQHDDRVIADCQAWVALHYSEANPVSCMVARSGLAERTFKRRFRAATGYAPMDYVQTLRIEEAKQILETSDVATEKVARTLGYEDPTFFRRLFKKRTGITPGRYRQRFGSVASL